MRRVRPLICLLLVLTACDDGAVDEPADLDPSSIQKVEPGKADTSAEAIILELAFTAELRTTDFLVPQWAIKDQLLYTVGQLNGDDAVGRLDKVELTNLKTAPADGEWMVKYDAVLQVAWRKSQGVPDSYTFQLPKNVGKKGQKAFTEKYSHDCVEAGAHDIDSGSMWYYYRPQRSSCALAADEIIEAKATVSVSEVNTTGKYPEYDQVWSDSVFQVVAVFGKYEDGATHEGDAGVRAYNNFNSQIRDMLASPSLDVVPRHATRRPGIDAPDVMYSAKIDDTHRVVVHALLVDNVRTAGAAFDARYGELSRFADLIVYNGHAGLGANIRALAGKGEWQAGQYAMVFLNGCDTYAYVDTALFDAHAKVNEDDELGTKYTDVITNALPAFFASMPNATLALVKSLMRYQAPRTYEQIFQGVDSSQVVLVSGEQDNVYVPGGGEAPVVSDWEGMARSGVAERDEELHFETAVLPAGTYSFTMSGTGDADLYVRVGLAPTVADYDCRPHRAGSNEACKVVLPAPARLFGMVRGYSESSTFDLAGAAER